MVPDIEKRARIPADIQNYLKVGGKSALLKQEDCIEIMSKITHMRLFGVLAIHVFDLKIKELHSLLENGLPKESSVENRTVYSFFRARFVTLRSNTKLADHAFMKESLLINLSPYERELLKNELTLLVPQLEEDYKYLGEINGLIENLDGCD